MKARKMSKNSLWVFGISALLMVAMIPGASAKINADHALLLQEMSRPSLLLFPFDSSDPSTSAYAELATDVAWSRLVLSGKYQPVRFYRYLSPIARALQDQQLGDQDVSAPFSEDNTKGIRLAKIADYDYILLGSIDSYDYNANTHQVSITMSGRLLKVSGGRIIKSVTLSGGYKNPNGSENSIADHAIRTTADKLMTGLVGTIRNAPIPSPHAKNAKK